MRAWLACHVAGLLLSLLSVPAFAQGAKAQCTTLSCAKCTSICQASCDADLKACDSATNRYCPRNYRSCLRGCPSQLCAQCLPIQYGSDGKKFLPGKTELCRTPGTYEAKKP